MEAGKLTPDWFRILVDNKIDYTEVGGWRMTGKPEHPYQSYTELKTIGCIMYGPAMEESCKITKLSKSSLDDKVMESTTELRKAIIPMDIVINETMASTSSSLADKIQSSDLVSDFSIWSLKVENLKHMEIQLDDIRVATNNFSEAYCIGSGAYGKVYKGELYLSDRVSSLALETMNVDKLPRKSTVATKCNILRVELGNKGFLAQLELLSRCENPNVLRLFGFCVDGPVRILVYEYASNGSLDNYLNSTDKMINLTWDQRLKMCLGIAYGLNYLHKAEGDKRITIHGDIKSDNILLDENLEVKIADFGLSLFHPINHSESTIHMKNFAGTNVYADPEYLKTGKLKIESNIYSFGVVLFEILSGKSAYDSYYTNQYEMGLAPVAREHFSKGTILEMVDATLMSEAHELGSRPRIRPHPHSLETYCKIAYECLAETQAHRPKIDAIIKELEKALHFQEESYKIAELSKIISC
uniref:probable serine/threonine-protein kinase PBL28 n=1 Tax=Erigeron canadensis TaxID=72917 RepID=UPI001CB8F885|nr:probable serine/threonine-protein kinase PBL28 [Erigeron canadensis]